MNLLIDASALKPMFNGDNSKKAVELRTKLKKISETKANLSVITPMSNFLRAIWEADPKAKIGNIQKTMSSLTILPSLSDFRNKQACIDDILLVAKTIGGNDENDGYD